VSSLRIVLLPLVCLMLSACTQYQNRYLEREDTVTSSAGDAVASNAAVQIPTPWPRYSNDTTIAMDGERIARAVDRYRVGEKQPVVTIPDDRLYGSTFGSANAGSPGFAAPSAQGAGPAPAEGSAAAPGPQGY
jgi:type IV pilus biogenesis protein CpaD/CtpE